MRTKALVLSAVFGLVSAGALAAQQPVDAAALFGKTCASCHGAQGTPNPAMAHAMAGIPDFRSAAMASVSDSVLREVIANGKGRMMAAYKGRLTPEQIAALARYVKAFSRH